MIELIVGSACSFRVRRVDIDADDYLKGPFDYSKQKELARVVLPRQRGLAQTIRRLRDLTLSLRIARA
jgi:DNA-binding response OmpR family regulator